jgi:hypothetical protein
MAIIAQRSGVILLSKLGTRTAEIIAQRSGEAWSPLGRWSGQRPRPD